MMVVFHRAWTMAIRREEPVEARFNHWEGHDRRSLVEGAVANKRQSQCKNQRNLDCVGMDV